MTTESYFRLPAQLKIRKRDLLSKAGMRPASLSQVRAEIEMELHRAGLGKEEKILAEKFFEILMSLDIRMQRIEEQNQAILQGGKGFEMFNDVELQIGAEGIVVAEKAWPYPQQVKESQSIEILLPFVPEWAIQVILKPAESFENNQYHFRFQEIHKDDQELIHRFVRMREREVLRARQSNR